MLQPSPRPSHVGGEGTGRFVLSQTPPQSTFPTRSLRTSVRSGIIIQQRVTEPIEFEKS